MGERVLHGFGNSRMPSVFLASMILLTALVVGPPANTALAQCSCPWVGDINADGIANNILDMLQILTVINNQAPPTQDPQCPAPREDFNADGVVDIRDIQSIGAAIFFGGIPAQNPCACAGNPALCDPMYDPSPGDPGNSVVIDSRTAFAGESGVRIAVQFTNDVNIRSFEVPLVLREITPGSFVTSVRMLFEDRLAQPSQQILSVVHLEHPDGTCPGGFGTAIEVIPTDQAVPVAESPEAFAISGARFSSSLLAAGADATGSVVLEVDVTSVIGSFEIDTTCTDPTNHLEFIVDNPPMNSRLVPSFTAGIINIVPNQPPVAVCQDVTVAVDDQCASADASIDNGSFDPDGAAITITQNPAGPYPLGETLVTLTVEDSQGETDQCQATVFVVDSSPPDIICPDDIHINIAPVYQGWVLAFAAEASDNCPGDVDITYSQQSGTFFPNGTTEVFCTATDAAGNIAECSFLVTVVAECYDRLADANCDGVMDATDLNIMIDALFFGGQIMPCTSPPLAEPPE